MLIAIGLLFVVGTIVLTVTTAHFIADGMRARLAADAERAASILEPGVIESAIAGDYTDIEQTLRRRVAQDDVLRAEWVDNAGRKLVAEMGVKPKRKRPDWFADHIGLEHVTHTQPLEQGGASYGSLRLAMNTARDEERTWHIVRFQFLFAVTGGLAVFGAISALLTLNLRALRAIRTAAGELERGGTATTPEVSLAPGAPPELVEAARAFNSMSTSVKTLITQLHREKEHALVVLHSIGDGVITTDRRGQVEYLNPVAESLLGLSRNQSIGLPIADVYRAHDERGGETADACIARLLERNAAPAGFTHYTLTAADGAKLVVEQSAAALRDERGETRGAVIVFRNVTEARAISERLAWQATHDSLTGLPNRSTFDRRLQSLITEARAGRGPHALVYLDLDQFKVVNDTCGHAAGDELLRRLADTMQARIGPTETVARLGGDEFGILLPGRGENEARAAGEAFVQLINHLPFTWTDQRFTVGASAGVVVLDADSVDAQEALRAADSACYAAKDDGRNRVRVYHVTDSDLQQRRNEMQWVARVREAFEHERFYLVAQPILGLGARASDAGFEILMRMRSEEGKEIPPGLFLPAAERYGVMPALDRWVVQQAFVALRRHLDHLAPDLVRYHINLSGASLGEEHFVAFLRDQFAASNVPCSAVCFEITETAAIANIQRVAGIIHQLRALGCEFALDDFGSGLSSFRYLKHLPVDLLKIDGAFVKNMATDPVDRAMVASINQIGHVLGIRTVAEYVEDADSLEALKQMGVDYAQGYHIGRPAPVDSWMTPRRATR